MQLSETDLRDLAAFLARRVTTSFEPFDPTDAPPPVASAADVWLVVLREAQARGNMSSLAARIRAVKPLDATLQEACRLLAGPSEQGEMGAALLVAVAAVGLGTLTLTSVVVAGSLLLLEAHGETSAVTTAISAPRRAEGLPDPGDDRSGAVASNAAADPSGHDVVAVAARVEDGPPEPSPEPGAGSLVDSVRGHGKCRGRPGEAVGYWYAGRLSPGRVGDLVDLDRSVNVRVAYPEEANGWSSRTRIACVLAPGDRVRISRDPHVLRGGHVWVPLLDGDLRSRDEEVEVASLDGEVDDHR